MYEERVGTEYFKSVSMWGIHTIEWVRELRYLVRCLASAILRQINLKETVWNGCSIANQLFHSWNGFLKTYTSQMWYLLKILRGERNRDLRVVSLMTTVVCYSRVLQLYMWVVSPKSQGSSLMSHGLIRQDVNESISYVSELVVGEWPQFILRASIHIPLNCYYYCAQKHLTLNQPVEKGKQLTVTKITTTLGLHAQVT